MANLLQSLQESQQGYQQHNPNNLQVAPNQTQKPTRALPVCLALVLVPSALATVASVAMRYSEARDNWLASNTGGVEVVEVSAPTLLLDYPDVGVLLDTQRRVFELPQQVHSVEDTQPESSSKSTSTTVASAKELPEQSDDLLEGIDLSSLSPDIAQRLQAAIQSDSPIEQESETVQSSPLNSEVAQWAGKLPALNFQTHVYSSDPNKRWVKVNGVEHQEGEWLTDGVQLIAIEAQACVVEFDNQRIEIPALYDWQG
ncbi:general secretion pathway protein GspB [Vibrio panuliri]|uniref:Type II secretion system protein GspB C-terminal domain-containing protein n=1 Tax=Vibrio panuliri TaxID=1381081 RepID=A0ABX3FR32_9VIBR|nr:general secretion pathway protein GspB [Vibrio panuliri]KAB1460086.1 general secretion pathway protein GspB [Vibrio panuliri]OLQ96488.1 hypothetical protein BIY20_04625 [Vibrio panuliri]